MALPEAITPYISVGKQTRKTFQNIVEDFYDDFDTHLWIRGQAGVGKTFTVLNEADKRNTILLHVEGNITPWLFTKKVATYLYNAGWPGHDMDVTDEHIELLPNIVVYIDDAPSIFEGDFVDIMKIALEQDMSDKLVYNKSLGGQFKQAEKWEQEAITHFRKDMEPGFTIPFFGKVKFIFTMNHKLVTDIDIKRFKANTKNPSLKVQNSMEDRYALFSRVTYSDLYMNKEEYWGWIADLLLNENILTDATNEDIEEILSWVWDNWDNLKEKSVRMVKQKLWKDLNKSKSREGFDYKSRWMTLVERNIEFA